MKSLSKEIEDAKNNTVLELRNIIIQIKSSVDEFNTRMEGTKNKC